MRQLISGDAEYAGKHEKTWREQFLEAMEHIVPSRMLLALISPHYQVEGNGHLRLGLQGMLRRAPDAGLDRVQKVFTLPTLDDVLFRVDPTSQALAENGLDAKLANAEASSRELAEQSAGAVAGFAAGRVAVQQAEARVRKVPARLKPARMRVDQLRDLSGACAGDRLSVEAEETHFAGHAALALCFSASACEAGEQIWEPF